MLRKERQPVKCTTLFNKIRLYKNIEHNLAVVMVTYVSNGALSIQNVIESTGWLPCFFCLDFLRGIWWHGPSKHVTYSSIPVKQANKDRQTAIAFPFGH